MANDIVLLRDAEKFQRRLCEGLLAHEEEFWHDFSQLKPKDKCELYFKMASKGMLDSISRLNLSPDDRKTLVLEETKRKATIIAGGIQQAEDVQYEEDE